MGLSDHDGDAAGNAGLASSENSSTIRDES
ncbi:MAG: hypothetical protein CM15mP92_1360 [Halieaceae bacterium]|nr:MAG: hypothetical protein CM15mP92_1360 [Halieaceae bacterium]